MNPVVIIEKINENQDIKDHFKRSFNQLSIHEEFNKADAVFVKPNLTFPEYKEGITTRKSFIEDLIVSLREINSSTKIYIGEGEGGYNSFSMTEALHNMGYFELEKKYPNIKIVNLSESPSQRIKLIANNYPYYVDLPAFIIDEVNFSITCPVPKVHCMTKITLSLKNQWGCLTDVMRLKNHYVFDQIIPQVCEKLKFKYAFLDGRFGLDDNGPMRGIPMRLDWFVASNSLGAFDRIVTEMMGFNWKKIKHLKTAKKLGFIPKKDLIDIIGNIEQLRVKFSLNRTFWNYPALLAFGSKKITHLFYFSMFSKVLHDIMYIFRKRAVD